MIKAAARSLLGETERYRLQQMLRTVVGTNRSLPGGDVLSFTCNICRRSCREGRSVVLSDGSSCQGCGSSSRFRAVIYGLSLGLYGQSRGLPDFPTDKRIRGIGMTDWIGYACRLQRKFDYTNTYYHKAPYFDVTTREPLSPDQCDFVLSSDVFEHVRAPVAASLANVLTVLKPGGLFVVTVPCSGEAATREHFPNLHRYEVVRFGDELILVNRTSDGTYEVFDRLVFHGGPGDALELRCFSPMGLANEMHSAGFVDVHVPDPDPSIGFVHADPPEGVLVIGRKAR